jgi:mono/diheme cytochrome c family protein
MSARSWLLLLVAGVIAVLSLPASAQGPQVKREPARVIGSVEGVDLYDAYCAVCHGKDGKGGGPAVPALKIPVPDLTTIAKRHGKFSLTDTEEAITGRGKMTPAHGSPDMPIWGPIFRALTPDEAGRTLRVTNLLKYVESIQVK